MKRYLFLLTFALLGVGANEAPAQPCHDAVQGEIAWNYDGDTKWAPQNVQRLCKGAEDSRQPARCFEQVMHGGVNWGRGTHWEWKDALKLCQGTRDADATITCFEGRVEKGLSQKEAIQACGSDADEGGDAFQPDTFDRPLPSGDEDEEGEGGDQTPPVDIDLSHVVGSQGNLARIQVSGAETPSDLGAGVGEVPTDLDDIEPADRDFYRDIEPLPKLTWTEKMELMERSGIPFARLSEPPKEFTLSPRDHFLMGVGHLYFRLADVDPSSDRALIQEDISKLHVSFRAPEASRYLLVFRVSSREETDYQAYPVGHPEEVGSIEDFPGRGEGSHNLGILVEPTEPGYVKVGFGGDHYFVFHDVTITRVE